MTAESILYIFKFPKVCILIVAFIINVTQHPEVASQYQVLTVPVAIVFVGEREFARQGRFIDMELFEKQLQQAKEFAQMKDYPS